MTPDMLAQNKNHSGFPAMLNRAGGLWNSLSLKQHSPFPGSICASRQAWTGSEVNTHINIKGNFVGAPLGAIVFIKNRAERRSYKVVLVMILYPFQFYLEAQYELW